MTASPAHLGHMLGLRDFAGRLASRLAGPILDKELRVTSRRHSHYWLRFGYVACLTLFTAITWSNTVGSGGGLNLSYEVSHMAQAGQEVVAGVLWFQFAAAQGLALLLLATDLPSEVTRGTLGTLACTPISSMQIVWGKLVSRLLQVAMLIALSLPVLAVVRVFGGVAWGPMLGALCVCLISAMFVGSWVLWLSVRFRGVLTILILTLVPYGVFALFPIGPLGAMSGVIEQIVGGASRGFFMPLNQCGLMIVLTNVLLRSAAKRVPALVNQPFGPAGAGALAVFRRKKRLEGERPAAVKGAALLWKDLRTFLPATRRQAIIGCGASMGILAISYLSFLGLRDDEMLAASHRFFLYLYLTAGMFVTVLAASTAFTAEKESRALPILLTAPISDTQIVLSKSAGVFYRALAAWALLVLHLLLFTCVGQIHPLGAIALVELAACQAVFLTGLGLWVSSILRNSGTAVTVTVLICAAIWGLLPLVAGILGPEYEPVGSITRVANPFSWVYVTSEAAVSKCWWDRASPGIEFRWRGFDLSAGGALALLTATAAGYSLWGLALAWRARTLMRRRLFA